MISFGDSIFYIDIDAFGKALIPVGFNLPEKIITKEIRKSFNETGGLVSSDETTITNDRGIEIDSTKYEILRYMLDVILENNEEEQDTALGTERALEKNTFGYKLAFNTLLNYGILKEK